MLTCKNTYLFVGVGVLIAVAGALYIASDSIEMADSNDEKRQLKAGLKLGGNILLLLAGIVLLWKGNCIRKVEEASNKSPLLPTSTY